LSLGLKCPCSPQQQDTILYLYYGNPSAENQENKTDVWDSNYKMVQHLKDDTTSTTKDSTSNNNHGTKKAVNEPIETDGQIAKAQSFDGSNDYINCGNNANLNITDAITLEAWVKPASYVNWGGIIVKGNWAQPSPYSSYALDTKSGDYFKMGLAWGTETVVSKQHSTNVWYHVAGTWNGIKAKIYVNGVKEGEADKTGSLQVTTGILAIGVDHPGGVEYFNGLIDEARISNIARSPEWIATEYANQNDPASFYTIGQEETI